MKPVFKNPGGSSPKAGRSARPNIYVLLLVALLVLTVFSGCAKKEEPKALEPLTQDIHDLATDFIQFLVSEDFESAVGYFDADMLKALSADQLGQLWGQLLSQVGPYREELSRVEEETQGYQVIIATVQFEKSPLNIRMVFNEDHRIAGLFFQPAEGTTEAPGVYETPDYASLERTQEREITLGEGDWALPGTLTLPAEPIKPAGGFPVVILVHGSGPNDRDETIGPNKPFKDLALGLASEGVAVLRYDKRTLVHGQRLMSQAPKLTVWEETVEDALKAVALAKSLPEIDSSRVYVLGHSLGGMLAPRIGAETDPGALAGLIIMAGAARPLEVLMLEQMTYLAELDGDVTEDEKKNLLEVKAHIKRIQDPELDPATPPAQLLGVPASYWLDLQGYEPAQLAKTLNLRMLILQGERDYQVTMKDYELWRQALKEREDVVFKAFPELNHLMMAGKPGQGLSTPEEYSQPGHVSVEVIQEILAFVK